MSIDGMVTRTAKQYGDQGCVIHPEGQDSVYFTPVPVRTTLADADSEQWPMRDITTDETLGVDIEVLPGDISRAVDPAAVEQRLKDDTAGDIDPSRLAQEVAHYADRSDITEELVRLRSHIDKAAGLLDGAEVRSVFQTMRLVFAEPNQP